jgi:hypothetical protein
LDPVHHPVALAQHERPLAEAHQAQEAPAQVAVVSSVGEAADAALVDSEAADDDRFSLCNRWRLGFHHAA